jgi:hypothetical protein
MCGGFSLSEPIHLENFEFTIDYFSGRSLSPRRGDDGTAFVGSTRSRAPTLQWAMIEDRTEDFRTASSGEGSFDHPSPTWCNMGSSFTPSQPQHERRML